MKSNLIIYIVLGLILSSCLNTRKMGTVWLEKGNRGIYKYTTSSNPPSSIVTKQKIDKGYEVELKEAKDKEFYLIEFFDSVKIDLDSKIFRDNKINIKNGKVFFPYDIKTDSTEIPPSLNKTIRAKYFKGSKLRYLEQKPILQAITIPIKIRPSLDDLPYQVSAGVNLGIALGWETNFVRVKGFYRKVNDNNKHSSYRFMEYKKNEYSISPAIFIGPTVIELDEKNTEGALTESRKIVGLNTGALIVGGVNKFHLGFGAGWDFPFGSVGNNWIYDGKIWYGFVVGLEFIK